MDTPGLCDIRWARCNSNGCETILKNRPFIILTKKGYNEKSSHVVAVPCTSSDRNKYFLNYALNITNDDVNGGKPFTKGTVVLCDRPCRLDKIHIDVPYDEPKIKEKRYNDILEAVTLFIKEGKISED